MRDNASPDEILRIRADETETNAFIAANESFILQVAGNTVKHYVGKSDDEFSIGLMAFHEALLSYAPEKGAFHAFAGLVIKRRLLDKLKSDYRFRAEIPADTSGEEPDGDSPEPLALEINRKQAMLSEERPDPDATPGTTPIMDEIEAVQQLLSRYGFSFYDLASCSPKSKKTKEACAKAVCVLLQDQELFAEMRRRAALPAKKLLEMTGLPRKILERHRNYIIAAAEILNGDYPLLAEYMSYIRKALKT